MRYIIAILLVFSSATGVLAADKYQLIHLLSTVNSQKEVHVSLVTNLSTGDFYSCAASVNTGTEVKYVQCTKSKINSGTMPGGPAFVSYPSSSNSTSPIYAGLWKIDQSSGDVTFCEAAAAIPPTTWSCGVGKLP
jgi:hypothetical protein